MADLAAELRSTVASETIRLLEITDADAAVHPLPGKWSPREVIGHLIDSAVNNYGRFARARLADYMVFSGYEQDEWVRLQRYNERPWTDLIELWRGLNFHIASLIESMPSDVLSRQRTQHDLDKGASKTVPVGEPVTLDCFIDDYHAHMKHHLGQIR